MLEQTKAEKKMTYLLLKFDDKYATFLCRSDIRNKRRDFCRPISNIKTLNVKVWELMTVYIFPSPSFHFEFS